MEPLVSIIIPAYNADRFISETIDSILKQTYDSWELIIVNDGSTDKTKEIIGKYISSDSRIRIINQSNKGVSIARNTGIENAQGQFIALLDADDLWLEDNLKEKVNLLLSNAKPDFVFSDKNRADEKMQNILGTSVGSDCNILEDYLLWNKEPIPGPCSNLVFKKSCFGNNVRFHPELSNFADKHFAIQLARQYVGKRVPKALWNYRVVSGSMSKDILLHETDSVKGYMLFKESAVFKSDSFRRICFSNMYLVVAASWWKDGNNKIRALYFLLKAFFIAPFHTIKKILSKFFKP